MTRVETTRLESLYYCKQYHGHASSTASPQVPPRSEFPPLIQEGICSQIDRHRPNPCIDTDSVPHRNEKIVETEQKNSLNMFNNSVYFMAFLAEVIQQTILATQRKESIDVFEIIAKVTNAKKSLHTKGYLPQKFKMCTSSSHSQGRQKDLCNNYKTNITSLTHKQNI